MRLCVLFRVPPSRIDEVMTGADACKVLDYLARYPTVEDVADVQLARLLQIVGQLGGVRQEFRELLVRGEGKSEAQDIAEWFGWMEKVKRAQENECQN